ncbi:MAG TPA: hypothetical protein VK213_08245 [Bacteroidales bacterium]|nr:hypothetical protein [Bacteroidales bacterium]
MKTKIILLTSFIFLLFISACNFNGQEQSGSDRERVDSMKRSDRNLNEQLDNAKSDRKESEARTKDAKLVEKNASDASVESRKALKAEKRAQRARQKADEQAGKTKNAIEKSEKDR